MTLPIVPVKIEHGFQRREDKNMTPWEYRLVVMLRVSAVLTGAAILAVFMPMSWMAFIHDRLEMGPLPQAPVVEYLARSTSAFYAMHGGLLWLASTDLRRFAPLITYIAWTGLACGVGFLVMDHLAGMPKEWALSEGPVVIAISGTILFLKKKALG
jgi:hypothetical protein